MKRGRTLAISGVVVVWAVGLSVSRSLLSVESPATPANPEPIAEVRARATPELPPLPPSAPLAAPVTPPSDASASVSPVVKRALETLLPQGPIEDADDLERAIGDIVDKMSDAELRTAIAELTDLAPSDLDQIRDLRDYAQRLAGIAASGVFTKPVQSAPVPNVLFSQSVDELGAPTEMAGRFEGTPNDRIYALFPTESYTSDKVLVKWYREGNPRPMILELLAGPPRLLTFGRYPIRPGDALSHVWLSRTGRWEVGSYAVEFYDPAEPLVKLAEGRFEISREAASGG
jgi:hypothetical protein